MVEVLDESENLSSQIIGRSEIASFDNLANQYAEPNLHLVHPGSMLGSVVENDPVSWVTQEFCSGGLGF